MLEQGGNLTVPLYKHYSFIANLVNSTDDNIIAKCMEKNFL